MPKGVRQTIIRSKPIKGKIKVRESGRRRIIEGYFYLWRSKVEIAPGTYQVIDRHAFDHSILVDDIRAIVNDNRDIPLGRTRRHTLALRADDIGIYATIEINPSDSYAMDVYERVKRGDIGNGALGYVVNKSDYDTNTGNWVIKEAELYAVSIATFPFDGESVIEARAKAAEERKQKELKHKDPAWREELLAKLNRGKHK